jgi:oxygen-independent coproporphyrinogen-3 oxidase
MQLGRRKPAQHDLWRYSDYLGIGPGAHGRITLGGEKIATATERHPETWLDQVRGTDTALSSRTG